MEKIPILSEVKNWCLVNLIDTQTLAMLLVGSQARGNAKPFSDIDLLLIKECQSKPIENRKIYFRDKVLDVWIHNSNYVLDTLNKRAKNMNDLLHQSLYLSLFRTSKIWYEKSDLLQEIFKKVECWRWNPEDISFLDLSAPIPTSDWAKKAFNENIKLLELMKEKFKKNAPLFHRLKEYPELNRDVKKEIVEAIFNRILSLYQEFGFEREWTELLNAKKAIREKEWAFAFSSLKDVLYFMLRSRLSGLPKEIKHPSIWAKAETAKDLPVELKRLLELVYSI
ncbi:MAG: nucleotidyltransferase domain-containing protein [Candidatus Heimdallarchaeaceae archaeon]